MKKALLALFVVVSVASICFAEETLAPSSSNNSANVTQASSNTTIPTQVANATIALTNTTLPASTGTTAPASVGTTTFTGKVNFVSSGSGISGAKPQITVQDDKGQVMTFVVPSDTTIIGKDGNPTTFNWIGRDDKVSIEYITAQDGTETAKSIKVSSAW